MHVLHWSAALSITAILLVGCAKPEPLTDSEIMQARNWMADFNQKMERIEPKLYECTKQSSQTMVRECRTTVYDSVGMEYDVNAELDSRKFREKKEKSLYPLSTELK